VHAYIIEDEYLIAKALQDMLEELGFTKFSFARSEDAAVFGANHPDFDLITADVRLLPGDGVNAVEKICKDRNIPVLFITAYREELEERKPDAVVLQKPVKADELADAVRRLLSNVQHIRVNNGPHSPSA
jgi:DNA-binding response OmpR family regulator